MVSLDNQTLISAGFFLSDDRDFDDFLPFQFLYDIGRIPPSFPSNLLRPHAAQGCAKAWAKADSSVPNIQTHPDLVFAAAAFAMASVLPNLHLFALENAELFERQADEPNFQFLSVSDMLALQKNWTAKAEEALTRIPEKTAFPDSASVTLL
jgi:hypothetical protein